MGNYYEHKIVGIKSPPDQLNAVTAEYMLYFPIAHQERETVVTSYYYADGERIAMKNDGIIYYLFSDHLGSTTSVVARDTGEEISHQLYHPWGTTRYSYPGSGEKITDYGYTGQMQVDDIYYYNARWYDPMLGRFMQADTLVPPHQGTQGFDRYAYTNNNPMKYTDPSGFYACGDIYDEGCLQTIDEINQFGFMRYWNTGEPFEFIVSGSYDFGLGKVEQIDRYQDDMISPSIPLKNPIAWTLQLIDLSVRLLEEFKPLPPYVPKDDLYWDIHVYAGNDIFKITKIAFWSPEETISVRDILFSTTEPYHHFDKVSVGEVIFGGSGFVMDLNYSIPGEATLVQFSVTCYGCMTGSYYRDRFTPVDNPWDIIVKPLRRTTYE